ncbi:hypothetical protein AOLI_G00275450 [Acnodon oligacanthus]
MYSILIEVKLQYAFARDARKGAKMIRPSFLRSAQPPVHICPPPLVHPLAGRGHRTLRSRPEQLVCGWHGENGQTGNQR